MAIIIWATVFQKKHKINTKQLNAFRILCDCGGNDDDDVQNIYLRKKYLLGIRSVGILGVCHIDGDNYEEYDLKL